MTELIIYKEDGSRSGTLEVAEGSFGTTVKKVLLKDAIVRHLANQRQGSANTRGRSRVVGSNAKPWRQKGTGRARAGSRKSPIWRGGGTVFGPKPRDFSQDMPKKARREALRSALLAKFNDQEIIVIDDLPFDKPATRKAVDLLNALGIRRSCLIVVSEPDKNFYLSVRNVQKVDMLPEADLNPYAVIAHQHLLVTCTAMESLLERFAK